jgi:4-hydroxy-3-methylbut-2-enyl diphosphate reductase
MENLTKGYEGSNLNLNEEARHQSFSSPVDSDTLTGTAFDADANIDFLGTPKAEKRVYASPMDEFVAGVQNLKVGDLINGRVTSITKEGVMVDLDYKTDGLITYDELSYNTKLRAEDVVKVGDVISCLIMKVQNKEGHPLLSKKRADYEVSWKNLAKAVKNREAVDIRVISTIGGGLVVEYMNCLRGFVPTSHVSKDYQDNLEALVGQVVAAKPLEADRRRRKLVLSHRLANAGESSGSVNNSKRSEIIHSLQAGQVIKGKVSSVKSFGAFVDIGGAEGLVHISELSWSRVNKVEDVLNVGDVIDVFVIGVDEESNRISLGIKQLTPDPWTTADEKYKVGQLVKGTVVRNVSFGAFVKLADGLEGLIHISELSDTPVKSVDEAVKIGQEVEARVLRVNAVEQKIGLSLRKDPKEGQKDIEEYQAKQEKSHVTIGDLMAETAKEKQS